jgi:hypothetical protein
MPQPNIVVFTPSGPASPPEISSVIMKFVLVVASFFALGLTLVKGGASEPYIPRPLYASY